MNTRFFLLPIMLLACLHLAKAQPGLIVNEISQGTNGGKEYAELVVVGDPCTTVDLRGWIIDDNNGEFVACPGPNNGALSGCGIASGHVRFSYDPIWQEVPVGTIILVYAYDPANPDAQADIGGLSVDYTDSDCDWVRVVPINASNTHMEMDVNTPHSPTSPNCTCPNGGTGNPNYTPATYVPLDDQSFSGLGRLGMRNGGDAFQTRAPNGTFFHGVSYGSTSASSCTPPPFDGGPDGLHINASGSNMVYHFLNTINDDYRNVNNWSSTTASSGQTPGQPNNCANAQWIASLRRPPESYFQSPGGCLTPTGTPQSLCVGEQISFSLPANTASCSSDSYSWSISAGGTFVNIVSSTNTTVTIEGIAPGNATVTLTATIDNNQLYTQGNCSGPMFPESLDYNFPVTVNPGPAASSTSIQACDNGNGTATFNLLQANNTVNQGSGLQVNWYLDPNGNSPIGIPTNYTSTTTTVYAQVVDPPCLSEIVPVTLLVLPVPPASPATLHGCDLGNGTALFDLTSLDNTVNQGSGNNVSYWLDPAATMPIVNPANYISATTTIFATADNGLCTSAAVPVSLIVDPQLTTANTFIQLSPASACGSATVTVTFTFPSADTYDVSMLYGNSTNGFLTYNGTNLSSGSTTTFNITQTTDFLLTSATPNSNPACGVNFPNPIVHTVTITPPPALTLLDTAYFCPGQNLDLTLYVEDQNNTGINISFHTSSPPTAANQTGPIVNPTSDTSFIAFADGGTGCQDQIEIPALLAPADTPQLDSAALCASDSLFNLISLQDTLYPNGSWSGQGVTDTLFNPAGLSGNITLTFTPDDPCIATATTNIYVTPQLQPTLSDTALCENADTFFLSNLQDSLFPNGSWSGQGVLDTLFIPDGLSGNIPLTFTPDNHCYLPDTTSIQVNTIPTFSNVNFTCDSVNQSYTVSFQINGGDSTSYAVNGQAVSGNNYTSAPIPSGTPFNFDIGDANNCGSVNLNGSFSCVCSTASGSMDVNAGPLTHCYGEDFDLSSYYNGDAALDLNDTLQFALHDNPGPTLGNLIALSSNGFFNFPAGLNTNQSYYVSIIAGNNDGNGQVDLSDPCLSVSQGIEISFYLPGLSANTDSSTCANSCANAQLFFSGNPPFTLYWNINNNDDTLNITQTDTTINICPADYGITSGNLNIILQTTTDALCSNIINDTFQLQVLPTSSASLDTTLCLGESLSINGTTYDQANPSGIELFPAASANGCDSTLNISLAFYPQAVGYYFDTLGVGESLTIGGTIFDEQNPAGQLVFPGASVNGCDSLLNVQLTFVMLSVQLSYSDPLCHNSADGFIQIEEIQNGKAPYWISLNGSPPLPFDTLPILFEQLSPGQYLLEITDADDIGITLEVVLNAPAPLVINLPEVVNIKLGENATLHASYNFTPDSLFWAPPVFLDDPGAPTPTAIRPLSETTYVVTAYSEAGCVVTAAVQLIINREIAVFAPNAFSPNGDGINDRFLIFAGPAVTEVELLRIFDRWGNQLFSAEHFPPNTPSLGWDGSYRGQDMNPGVYVYYARLQLIDGSFTELKGEVVLIR